METRAGHEVNGVWASLNFPTMIAGFSCRVLSQAEDPDLELAAVKAWSDWFFEEWYSEYPARLVPMGITFLTEAANLYRVPLPAVVLPQ